MPIYTYKCSECNHTSDELLKLNSPIKLDCPECAEYTYEKQVASPHVIRDAYAKSVLPRKD